MLGADTPHTLTRVIPTGFLQDLSARCNVVDVVGRYVTLKKAGINYKGLCPFHGEKTPSFIVSPQRQTYHCFGCGAHGDAIRFLTEHAGYGFVEAVRSLASEVGLQVPEDERSPQERERAEQAREERLKLGDALQRAARSYAQQLKQSPRAIDYLKRRGLTGEIAAHFRLGYAPAGWRHLAGVFPHYDDPVLVDSGLVITQDDKDGEARRYDRFRDRIMFPIRDVRGDVMGFGARVIDGGEPKYLNSPETPVFVKGRELYGLYEARTALRDAGYALVTEGYMDVVALAQLGFPHAVATLGTACTADHVHKLLRYTERVVFAFDGDAAGRRAAARAMEAALPHATDTRSFAFLFLPTEHDPDSYIRALGREAFEEAVQAAVPLSRQLVEVARQGCELDTAEGRARMLSQARPLWQALPPGALKAQVFDALATEAGMVTAQLQTLWTPESGPSERPRAASAAGAERRRFPSTGGRPERPRAGASAPGPLDRVLWILLHEPGLWQGLSGASHSLLAEQAAPYGPAFTWIERLVEEGVSVGLDLAQADPEDPAITAVLARVQALLPPQAEDDLAGQLEALMQRLELKAVESELQWLFESGPDLSVQAQERGRRLLTRLAELKKLASSPREPG